MKETQPRQLISLVSSIILFGVGGRAVPSVLMKTTRGSWRSVKQSSKLEDVGLCFTFTYQVWLSVWQVVI